MKRRLKKFYNSIAEKAQIDFTWKNRCCPASECYNLLNKEYQEKFRKTCHAIKQSTGYYPFPFFMYLRVEILRGHFKGGRSLFEYLYYGIKNRILGEY